MNGAITTTVVQQRFTCGLAWPCHAATSRRLCSHASWWIGAETGRTDAGMAVFVQKTTLSTQQHRLSRHTLSLLLGSCLLNDRHRRCRDGGVRADVVAKRKANTRHRRINGPGDDAGAGARLSTQQRDGPGDTTRAGSTVVDKPAPCPRKRRRTHVKTMTRAATARRQSGAPFRASTAIRVTRPAAILHT